MEFYIDIQIRKGRLTYSSAQDRDQDFTRIINFFKSRGFTSQDITLKRIDLIDMEAVGNSEIKRTLEYTREIQ